MKDRYTETVFIRKARYTVADIPLALARGDHADMEFASNLKRYREAAELSQDELAEKIDVSQPTIQRWETGKREPKFSDIEKLADALGIRALDLFRDEEGNGLPSADELGAMIAAAMGELPFGVSYADYPSAVAAGLHERLTQFRAYGGSRDTAGEATAARQVPRLPSPTTRPDQAEPHTPTDTPDS